MIGLPQSLSVNGIKHPIRTDYRVALKIYEALNDSDLTDQEKAFVTFRSLYKDWKKINSDDYIEAITQAYWFLNGGDVPKSRELPQKTIDWKYDEHMIFPAINKVACCEVRSLDYLHWWTFLGYFSEIGEGLFSTVMSIRTKIAKGKQLDKGEKDFMHDHRNLINILSEQDKKDIQETEDFLNQLFET